MLAAHREAPAHESRRDRLIREPSHDLYRTKGKVSAPAVCPSCKAVYHKGHWNWDAAQLSAAQELCPACRRIQDGIPAGYLTLKGQFLEEHRREIVNLLRNEESKAKALHALKRIMAVEREGSQLKVTTTDPHLARTLGDALHRAYHGELLCRYEDDGGSSYVTWER